MSNNPDKIMRQTLLIESVFKTFANKEVLQGVTIKAETGKITGLLGRNGCGKSTLLKILFGTQSANDCFIQWNGKKINHPYTINNLVNFLPQHHFLSDSLKVATILRNFQINVDSLNHYFSEIDAQSKIGELSGGQKRIVEAFTIIKAPSFFTLLDEPFTHIMPLHQQTIMQLIREEKDKKGFILTDHLYQNLLDLCNPIYLIKNSKSIIIQNKEELGFHGYISMLNS